jgi:hypothetical protein
MFTSIKGVWGFMGVSLALVALYLVLSNGTSAQGVISSLSSGASTFFKTLQARA